MFNMWFDKLHCYRELCSKLTPNPTDLSLFLTVENFRVTAELSLGCVRVGLFINEILGSNGLLRLIKYHGSVHAWNSVTCTRTALISKRIEEAVLIKTIPACSSKRTNIVLHRHLRCRNTIIKLYCANWNSLDASCERNIFERKIAETT